MTSWAWAAESAAMLHTLTLTHTQWNEWGFTFGVLNCLDGFYGLNGSWRMGRERRKEGRKKGRKEGREEEKKGRIGRERRWQSPRENEVQTKGVEKKKKGVKTETCFGADAHKHFDVAVPHRGSAFQNFHTPHLSTLTSASSMHLL